MGKTATLVSKLEIVPVRSVFPHEAYDFTTWLESQIETLGERLGLNLTIKGREQKTGDFIIDLVCEDDEGNQIVIENQLERSNHSHLGQLLTYLVNMEATKAIWITTDPRPEHQRVIEWLNESSSVDVGFYLVKVEAVRIGDSPHAPLFTVVVAPDRQLKEVGEKKKEWASLQQQKFQFWQELLEKSRTKTKLFGNISPGRFNYISMGAGQSGVYFSYTISRERGTFELCIDKDKEDGTKNKLMFDAIAKHKIEIEKSFGDRLEWERLDEKRMARIRKTIQGNVFDSIEERTKIQDTMIDGMIRLHSALKSYLGKIDDL